MEANTQRRVGEAYLSLISDRRKVLADAVSGVFDGDAQFVWEIGSGHGHFLTAYAAQHRDAVCVGIDIIGDRVERALRKRNRAGLQRLHFFHAEARLFLETLPPKATIARVFVLFPDPWPKTRHHKHRVIQPEFLALLRTRMRSDAELFFRTDHRAYFDYAKATLTKQPGWRLTDSPWPFEYESVFQQRAPVHYSLCACPCH
jgi:tRNA (guanine-N7-)-methyltransferase